jgi:hypothetical protein
MSYLSLTVRPRSPAFVVRSCLSSAHHVGTTAVSVGRICGRLLHCCIRRSSNLYMVCIACPLSVFVPCFLHMLPCASRLPFLTPTTCVRLFRSDLLRNGDSLPHVTSYLLLECFVSPFLIPPSISFPPFKKTCSLSTPKKANHFPTLGILPHPVFPPLRRPYPSHGFTIRSLGGDVPPPPSPTLMHFVVIHFVDVGLRAPLSRNG